MITMTTPDTTVATTDPEALAFAQAIDTETAAVAERAARLASEVGKTRRILAENDRRTVNFHGGVAALEARLAETEQALATVLARLNVLDGIYGEHLWSRFFLVTNANGHIHRSMRCSTCFLDTQFAWLPQLSGLTEAEAVAAHGEILCSVCFPSAPSAWCNGRSKASIEAAAERAAAKAERLAKKLAKALYADDADREWVSSETLGYARRLSTIAAAKAHLTDGFDWGWGSHPSYPASDLPSLAAVLAERLGTTPEAEIEAAKVRAAKRAKRR